MKIIILILFIIILINIYISYKNNIIIDKYTDIGLTNKIDKIYYINLENRTDRKEQFLNNFTKLENRIERIDAIKTPEDGAIGCLFSHIKALETAQKDNKDIVLICEDDLQLDIEKTNKVVDYIVNNIQNWDVIMLAHNTYEYENSNHKIQYNDNNIEIIKILDSQTASGYVVNKKYIDTLLNNLKNSYNSYKKDNIWKGSQYANDQSWKTLQKKDNWFATMPRIGFQRASYSDIQNGFVNYELFDGDRPLVAQSDIPSTPMTGTSR
jgi:glycosyl transferase family 25